MSFNLSFNLKDLTDLNRFLESRSYVFGFSATTTDLDLYKAIGSAPDAKKYPNVARFYKHIANLKNTPLPAGISTSTGAAPAAAKAPAAEEEDEDVDLFGDDSEDAAAKITAAAAAKAAAAPKEEKKAKAPRVDKTLCVYEVKPLEAGQDLMALYNKIRALEIPGLTWGENVKIEDIGYGIQKLVLQFVVVDSEVNLEDVENKIYEFEDEVQSVDQLSMNKLG